MFNCHTHIFTTKNVPNNFLPWYLRIVANGLVKVGTVNIFRRIGLKGLAYRLNRFVIFKAIGEKKGQAEVFKHLRGFYPEDTQHVVLSMDMEYMAAGKVPQPFEEQLRELSELKKRHGERILPFVFAHPNRPNIHKLVKEYITNQNFAGIKIYPALGYFPTDPRLDTLFAWAETKQIPIMTHCSRGGVYYKGKLTTTMRTDPSDGKVYPKTKKSEFTDVYTDPDRYEPLLTKYPKLKLCFAHFGGATEWDKYLDQSWHTATEQTWFNKIKELMIKYENVYTDISYTLYHPKYYGLLKVTLQDPKLRKKILFGTDYYMQEQETSERKFGINLRAYVGEQDFKQMAMVNPIDYLKAN